MATLHYYLNFPGTTEEALNFYKNALGGEIEMIQYYRDMPDNEKLQEAQKEKVMHASMKFADGSVLMATDALEGMGKKLEAGNNFYMSLNCESKLECDAIFNALSEGGEIEMALQDTFWGAYFGMWTDKFGIHWMVNYDEPK